MVRMLGDHGRRKKVIRGRYINRALLPDSF